MLGNSLFQITADALLHSSKAASKHNPIEQSRLQYE
jgi:hypothetical protein